MLVDLGPFKEAVPSLALFQQQVEVREEELLLGQLLPEEMGVRAAVDPQTVMRVEMEFLDRGLMGALGLVVITVGAEVLEVLEEMLLGQLVEPAEQEQILPSQAQRLQELLVGMGMPEEQMEQQILVMEGMVQGGLLPEAPEAPEWSS